jgi:hypothetical protein
MAQVTQMRADALSRLDFFRIRQIKMQEFWNWLSSNSDGLYQPASS